MVRQHLFHESPYKYYTIGEDGLIRSFDSSNNFRVLKSYPNDKGYLIFSLVIDGVHKNFRVHRLVGKYFLRNPDNLPQINHKNFDKTDNRVENLEWVSGESNIEHYIKNNPTVSKKVLKYDLVGNLVKEYASITKACKEEVVKRSRMSIVLNRTRRPFRGHIWVSPT